ncbi:MAG: HD-GYP domain-containing protein [Ornithinimicrobium sp.]|uniref:HD-GYP domain-containing protein n=1 Tax=Ornithinimicrobium sp. TaxID=1977084 RepID=UPI0017B70848|nr:HD domain-containing protein [Actinomycetota bacterium]
MLATAYVTWVAAAALVLGWAGLAWGKDPQWSTVVVLTGLGIVGASLREREIRQHVDVSFTTVVMAAALVLVGPGGAAIVGGVSYLADLRRQRWRTRAFNTSMTACMGAIGGFAYEWCDGLSPLNSATAPWDIVAWVAVPMLVGYVAMAVLNALLIGIMGHLVQGGSVVSGTLDILRIMWPGYLLHALLGLLLVVLWEPADVGAFSAMLILGPLLLAQWALSRDAAERRAHFRTVSTLMGALEVANPYAVGHSSRVAALCRRMAPDLGLTGEDVDVVYYAAQLHDLGLVATAPRLPRGPGQIELSSLAAIVEHPEAGQRMLEGIDFLGPALPGILHHHERWDGRGYPAGLAGEDIPLLARVIAVADAFDSLTTTRSYRAALEADEAMVRLWSRAGTHLDPAVVQALGLSLQRETWEPTVIDDEALARVGDVYDHDDPEVSDDYAAWQPEIDEARS